MRFILLSNTFRFESKKKPLTYFSRMEISLKLPSLFMFGCSFQSNSATSWTAAHQASLYFTISWSLFKLMSIESVMPSNHLILCLPLLPLPLIFPSIRVFPNGSVFLYQVAKVLEFQLQHHSLQRNPKADLLENGLVGSPCSPRDSQESSPTPQFKSINYSVLSLVPSPTLKSIHDHWKNHSLD